MKCDETKEEFEGVFDFEKEQMIRGKNRFEWKDKKGLIWICKGFSNFLKIFFNKQ